MGKLRKEKNTMKNVKHNTEDSLGLDQDEQAMNGEYGMVETEEEDRANNLDRD